MKEKKKKIAKRKQNTSLVKKIKKEKVSKEKKQKITLEHKSKKNSKIKTILKHKSKKIKNKNFKKAQKIILETYKIEVDGAKININIKKTHRGQQYSVQIPEINVPTSLLLDEIRNELVAQTSIGMQEILDSNQFNKIKKRFMDKAESLIKSKLPYIEENIKRFLIGRLMQTMLGLGEIEYLVADNLLEEIVIPSAKEAIRVYHKKYGWLITDIKIEREDIIANYSNIVARRVGRQITVLSPLLDAHLVSGDRVNSILYPISTKGNTITIRKFARDPYTVIDLIKNKTLSLDTSALLWIAVEYEMNILVSGGTASGKTVVLNSFMPFIPPNHRIISVEDTRELMLPEFLYWCPLVTRIPNPEGKGGVTMLDLLMNSLRMRPDRIILGEMRRKEEAMVLFEAMHTGHSVYATLHADSAAETISRLTNPPLSVPHNLLKTVNLNVVMFRDRKRGIRRVSQIAEFESSDNTASANILYRWNAEKDELIQHNESIRFYEDITKNTGMTEEEFKDNLKEKKKILKWLIDKNIRDLESLGKVINYYYYDKKSLLKDISQNNIKKILE
jgi:flagellar protein FlaI